MSAPSSCLFIVICAALFHIKTYAAYGRIQCSSEKVGSLAQPPWMVWAICRRHCLSYICTTTSHVTLFHVNVMKRWVLRIGDKIFFGKIDSVILFGCVRKLLCILFWAISVTEGGWKYTRRAAVLRFSFCCGVEKPINFIIARGLGNKCEDEWNN
jgi:hypothetical protein